MTIAITSLIICIFFGVILVVYIEKPLFKFMAGVLLMLSTLAYYTLIMLIKQDN